MKTGILKGVHRVPNGRHITPYLKYEFCKNATLTSWNTFFFRVAFFRSDFLQNPYFNRFCCWRRLFGQKLVGTSPRVPEFNFDTFFIYLYCTNLITIQRCKCIISNWRWTWYIYVVTVFSPLIQIFICEPQSIRHKLLVPSWLPKAAKVMEWTVLKSLQNCIFIYFIGLFLLKIRSRMNNFLIKINQIEVENITI